MPIVRIMLVLLYGSWIGIGIEAQAAIVSSSGTVSIETDPHASPANGVIYVFDEQDGVPFVSSQELQFGSIVHGTLVDSHYVQFDPVTPTGIVGTGSITFDGPILGIATSTGALTADLSPDVSATSDMYFGLEDTIGAYPAGADSSARGLGSPEDDLIVNIGSQTLTIDSLEIPAGAGGNLDGFRVFTATQGAAVPTHLSPWILAALIAATAIVFLRSRATAA